MTLFLGLKFHEGGYGSQCSGRNGKVCLQQFLLFPTVRFQIRDNGRNGKVCFVGTLVEMVKCVLMANFSSASRDNGRNGKVCLQ